MNQLDGLHQILGGGRAQQTSQSEGAAEGLIRSVDPDTQTATYRLLKAFDPNAFFGPVPYSSTGSDPQVGDKCLVVFIGNGIDGAWIVGWTSST